MPRRLLLDLDLDKLLSHLQHTQHGNLLDVSLFRERITGTLAEPDISNGGVLAKVLLQPLKTLAGKLLPGRRCIKPFYTGVIAPPGAVNQAPPGASDQVPPCASDEAPPGASSHSPAPTEDQPK